jgi:TolB-like protein/Tfp pilus assembly protein PilF/tRNA A-37 threonylcarbamoyl transferase component Bud32
MVAQNNDNQAVILEEALTRFVDVCLQGEKPDVDEFARQYPQCEGQLKERIQDLREIDFLFDSLVRADDSEFEGMTDPHDLVGQKLASFEVEKVIGRGGMGVVYLARDTKLDRHVAIKSIPAELQASSTAQTRFQREAKLLASLNHPNIAVIHEIIEQDEGAGYLILEYIPGQTLAERIAREPLEFEEALSIGQQVAEAVSAAHDKGVIHRDLKPGNIKITPDGRVKVLDFGLAKASVSEDKNVKNTVTQPGRVIGTPAYMSPEQARGKDTDHRTDIWSFGCIMYEMLTGHLPFEGETATDTLARIIEREPDWEVLPQETPTNIRTLLRRCLEKDPRRRLRDIGDIAITLEETTTELKSPTLRMGSVEVARAQPTKWSRRALPWFITGVAVTAVVFLASIIALKLGRPPEKQVGKPITAIVVLPFENLSGDPEQEYFVDGMTDALGAELGKIKALRVISRTSAMQYKDTDKVIPEIVKELGVDAVIEGSVLKAGNDVRVTAQLVDGRTDAHLWSDNYTGTLTNILALQSEVTLAIAREIEAALTPEEERRITRTEPVNPEAHEACLRGHWYFNKYSLEGFTKAREYFELAIEKDPNYAPAYAWLAMVYGATGYWGYVPPIDTQPKVKEAALKAIELDDTLAVAHLVLAGYSFYFDWDWPAAEREFKRAIELNPNLPEVRHTYSFYLTTMGRPNEAMAESKRAEELDPLNLVGMAVVAIPFLVAHRYDEAIEQLQKPLEMDPSFYPARQALWRIYRYKNLYEEAFAEAKKAFSLLGEDEVVKAMERGYAESGYRGAMRLAADELVARSKQRYVRPTEIARLYADAEEKDQTLHWLQRAYEERDAMLVHLRDPDWDSLRSDTRFQDLLKRMKYPP